MTDLHSGQPVRSAGEALGKAQLAVVLLHGRGGTADDILGVADALALDGVSYLAPQAKNNSWYPKSFLAPIEENEPWLSAALSAVERTVHACTSAGLTHQAIAVAGFSQGACLGTEYVGRYPARYAGLIAWTGGLIGPPDHDLRHDGSLDGTPVLLSSGDPDPHVPWERVLSSAKELERMQARVQIIRHAGRPHTILPSEIEAARALLLAARDAAPPRSQSAISPSR